MQVRNRKRCPFCRCLFWPDGRSDWRQWACGKPECQAQRRQQSQRRWRQKNKSDQAARRYRTAVAAAKAGEEVTPAPRSGPLVSLPWDEMRDEMRPEVLVLIALISKSLIAILKDEIRVQVLASQAVLPQSHDTGAKDEMAAHPRGP